MDQLLQYATNRIIELENLLLVDVEETVWPAEVQMVFSQIENAGSFPAHHQRRLQHHINRMWLEKMPVTSIIAASLVAPGRQASAIAFMFSGLTLANLLGVPAGTWLAQTFSWRLVFWVIAGIGLLTMASVALLVPHIAKGKAIALRNELRALIDPQVLLVMGITVFGPAAFFTSITYIAPMMVQEAGFSAGGVAGVMLLFGLGLAVGNWIGGRFADRSLFGTLFVTLAAQGLVLLIFWAGVESQWVAGISVFLMAAFGFATVSPIQKLVMERASHAGAPTMASSVNIGMFNLGNALGAWAGGVTIAAGFGLASPNWAGAILSFIALGLAYFAWLSSRKGYVLNVGSS